MPAACSIRGRDKMSDFPKIDEIQKQLLEEVTDMRGVPAGAFNIRANG